ncbi:PREDICTED: transcription factor bHLH123-like [Nelumbo nucifera]|uniref:Transcription factor bHLH123-like n=2 Tax=Nelumbo nucifera TaxID=4432 RepID=A0A1U7YTF8_NELNU|nr:PREDICTED: transcription factor bHLH123-like [Nelumbo nucifera]DAD20693.1 TPA_asm: hypothetical protein HUJ06_022156 [Nelumbo nucifera]
MADQFQTGVCSGNWWNPTRNGFNGNSSPCSTALNDIGSFGWPTEMVDMKTRSTEESASVCDSSIVFSDTQKQQVADSVSGGGVLMDSTLQIMGFGLSSPTTVDWNQALLRSSGRGEANFHSMLQEELSSRHSFRQETSMESSQLQKEWSPKNFSVSGEDSSINALKQINQVFALDQQRLNSINSSSECTVTCQGLPTSFPMSSTSYGCTSTLLQGLFETDPQSQQSSFENGSINLLPNCRINSNDISPSWPKFSQLLKTSPPKQQSTNQLHFSNKGPFWNASAAAMNEVRSSYFPSSQTQLLTPTFEEKPNCSNLTAKSSTEDVRDSASAVKKGNSEPAFKRPRIETPLPTFKVRKEKLGDRITALQQLVSPFGKTDTASVLFEAIEYIKFLHDQVSVLSTPYMKNGASIQPKQNSDKSKEGEAHKPDLRSRGLCLVPISSTYPVTNETAADFWTPTFGGTYR